MAFGSPVSEAREARVDARARITPTGPKATGRMGFASYLASVALFLAAALWLHDQLSRPGIDVLLVGPVTRDLVGGHETRQGGAVSYAASALAALGMRACVVTVAGPDADLSALDGHDVHVVPADATLTFEVST